MRRIMQKSLIKFWSVPSIFCEKVDSDRSFCYVRVRLSRVENFRGGMIFGVSKSVIALTFNDVGWQRFVIFNS